MGIWCSTQKILPKYRLRLTQKPQTASPCLIPSVQTLRDRGCCAWWCSWGGLSLSRCQTPSVCGALSHQPYLETGRRMWLQPSRVHISGQKPKCLSDLLFLNHSLKVKSGSGELEWETSGRDKLYLRNSPNTYVHCNMSVCDSLVNATQTLVASIVTSHSPS